MPRVMGFSLQELYAPLNFREVTQTVRLDRGTNYYQVGGVYRVWWKPRSVKSGHPIGLVRILAIERNTIDELTKEDAVRGGFQGPNALKKLRETLLYWHDYSDTDFLAIKFECLEEEKDELKR